MKHNHKTHFMLNVNFYMWHVCHPQRVL